MKKYLIALLLSLSCTFALAAVGCVSNDPPQSGSESESDSVQEITDPVAVKFVDGEGYSFTSNAQNGVVQRGSTLTFNVELGGFYTGSPLAYVNGVAIGPNADGSYSVKVDEEVTITATGVQKDISNMAGTGAFESPFQVSKPIDLLYIAEQVNKGNRTYATGAYLLVNDIDCKGEELQVIGNNPDDPVNPAFFSGCFVSNYSDETGASYRYTISNFELNTQGTNYVGLFGAVYADLSVESSGLFYGINLDNFTINAGMYREDSASSTSDTIACGGLIGYGVGVNAMLCGATNGEIYVDADESYFSFVGGLIGYQQGYYFTEYGEPMPSEVSYSYTDVDVTITQGLGLYAGGISGYLATNYPFGAIATINNSYSTGNVSGAIRSGGIAGGLGQYTSVSNCYATGDISAISQQSNSDKLWTGSEYCLAHAGGIVGFAENDTVANDCYFGGTLSAYTVSGGTSLKPGEEATDAMPNGANGSNKFAFANAAIGGGNDAGYVYINSEKYIARDCLSGDDIDLSNANAFTEKLSWQEYNWVFAAKKYPTINYAYSSEEVIKLTMTLHYVAPNAASGTEIKVNGNATNAHTYFDSAQQSPSYAPIGNFYATGSLSMAYKADNNGYRSYGYFFDPECTQRVPYSYLPMKNVSFYIGFADATPLIGTYYFKTEDNEKAQTLVFDKDGFLTYSDGAKTQRASYYFDGTNIVVEGARLARYYNGEIIVDNNDTSVYADANFDLYRYTYYNYIGKLSNDGLTLYDGTYFTEAKPLVASKTAPTLETYDVFKGEWSPSATVNKKFSFDGKGNFTYAYTSYARTGSMLGYTATPTVLESASGTYRLADGDAHTILFAMNDANYSATLNANTGALEIKNLAENTSFVCYREIGYLGSWTASGYTLTLQGIRADGTGLATFAYADGTTYELFYEASETAGYVCLYMPDGEDNGDFFGYFSYDLATNTLTVVLGDSEAESGYSAQSMYLVDDFNGEWISNASDFLNMEFEFDGNGLYGFMNRSGALLLTDGENTHRLSYTLDSTQNGKFSYNGNEYLLTFDHITGSAKITQVNERELERKDEFASKVFVDLNGGKYVLNGKGNLDIGGKLTVNGKTEYVYKTASVGYDVYTGTQKVGSIVKADDHYDLTLDGTTTDLYLQNEFMGSWAISGEFALFKIGPTDLNNKIQATFKGSAVTLTQLDPKTLTFRYRDEIGMPIDYYVFVIYDEIVEENVLVVSRFANLLGDYLVCSKANEMYGEWKLNTTSSRKTSIEFDGVSSSYQNGIARLKDSLTGSSTMFYYTVRDDGVLMWSQEAMGEENSTWYYLLTFTDTPTKDSFIFGERAFNRKRVDGLCLTKATDTETKQTYIFDGGCYNGGTGYIYVDSLSGAKKYAYTYITYNSNSSATLEVTDVSTNKKYSATLDYSDNTNITFTLGEEIAE